MESVPPQRSTLPPITSMMSPGFPILNIVFPATSAEAPTPSIQPSISSIDPHVRSDEPNQSSPPNEQEKAIPYSTEDDIEIIRAVAAFFGSTFIGKVPWSFWNTYIQNSGVKRTASSLYHHWNGAMHKKYGGFLNTGRLNECAEWLRSANSDKLQNVPIQPPHAGLPLTHNYSMPQVPLISYKVPTEMYKDDPYLALYLNPTTVSHDI